MNTDAWLDKLAARARLESPPDVDVSARVMARIAVPDSAQAPGPAFLLPAPFAWTAALAGAAALGLLAAGPLWQLWTDPLFGVLMSLTEGIL